MKILSTNLGFDFIISHTGIWVDIWVILALILLALIIIYFIVRRHKMVKTEEELEDLLAEKYEREGTKIEGDTENAAAKDGGQ